MALAQVLVVSFAACVMSTSAARQIDAPPRSEPADVLFLDNQLCFTLYATSLAMTKLYRRLLAPLGLTYPQYVVMLALWQHTELSAGALGEKVALDSGTLAPLIRKLTALGLVERNRSPIDDRSVLISMTRSGESLAERARAVNRQVACATQFSDAQIKTLIGRLKDLRAALSNSAKAMPPTDPLSTPRPAQALSPRGATPSQRGDKS